MAGQMTGGRCQWCRWSHWSGLELVCTNIDSRGGGVYSVVPPGFCCDRFEREPGADDNREPEAACTATR